MGAADGGEEERVRLSGDDAMKARIEGHGEGDCVKVGIVRRLRRFDRGKRSPADGFLGEARFGQTPTRKL